MASADYKDNAELLLRVREGDASAEAEIIEANAGLIRSIAARFRERAAEGHGCDFEDLIQIGTIGMIKAIKSYDPAFGTVFSTYAVPLIIGEIKRFLRDDGPVKISRTTKKLGVQAMRVREAFMLREGREPSVDELSELCGVTCEELCNALLCMKAPHSLSEPIGDDGAQLGELISSDENELDGLCDRLALREAIRALPKEQREIVVLRYFCDMSQQRTAEMLGLTQVKVSREEKKIFARLRAEL